MLKKLRIAIERTLIFAYDIFEYMRDVWAVHVKQRHRIVLRETKGQQPRPAQGSRVAIVALYPTNESLPFTKNLLRLLHGNGFFVLAISTRKLPDAMHADILSDCHHLIERVGVGRDFGSYKMGLAWLAKQHFNLIDTEILLLANDSLFFPTAFENEFKTMIKNSADWQCLFENFEHHYHAQSFFLLFRKNVFSSRAFIKFWERYQPYSSRRHSINHGEVKLSTELRQAGYVARALFNSARIYDSILDKNARLSTIKIAELSPSEESWPNSRNKIFDSIIKSSLHHTDTHTKTDDDKNSPQTILDNLERERWANVICHKSERSNPTHGLALIANNLFSAPIKRDICYRGSYDIAQVLIWAHGFSDSEKKLMAIDLNQRGLPVCLTGIRRLLWKTGRL